MYKKLTAIAFAAILAGTGASAAMFDFAAIADKAAFTDTNNVGKIGFEADWDTVVGAGLGILDVGSGISVIGSASNSAQSNAFAYFDSGSAGLGVCGITGNCRPGNDDNVGAIGGSANATDGTFEIVTLTFNQSVNISQLVVAAEGHGAFTGNLKINGVETNIVGGVLNTGLVGTVFDFAYIPVPVGTPDNSTNEFYIEAVTVSAVPVPASLPLLLGGLGAVVWAKRRRKAA